MSAPGELTYLRTVFADTTYLANNETGEGVQALYMTLAVLPGDTDGAGDVDDTDLGSLIANYTGPDGEGVGGEGGDTDGDGDVDDTDIGSAIANYTGPFTPNAAVPEPGAMTLLSFAGLALLRPRRAR